MAIRYLVRRDDASNLAPIEAEVTDLKTQLGDPEKELQRCVSVRLSAERSVEYHFVTRESGGAWAWVCPTLELAAEDEQGLFALVDKYQIETPSHLAHLR